MPGFPIGIYRVAERSMEPSIKEGSYIIVNRWFASLSVNDVVVARGTDGTTMVKRIKRAKKDRLYLLGDNRSESVDSRKFGWIDRSRVFGKIVAVV